MTILPVDFYDRDPRLVARELLGQHLVRRGREGICRGRIVETEAYLATGDSACHSHRGQTRKNATMFGRPGRLYVYPIHARYCLNAVTEPRGVASAVLIRAVEPLDGFALMQQRRGVIACANVIERFSVANNRLNQVGARSIELRHLARGPARLCEAFGVDRRLDGWNLTIGARIWIAFGSNVAHEDLATSPRIGVTSAHDLPLRFFVRGNGYVSRSSIYLART